MVKHKKISFLEKIILKTEIQLIQFFVYILILGYLLISGYGWWSLVFVHLFFALIYLVISFKQNFLLFLLAPLTGFLIPITNYSLKKYLKKFKQNNPTETVIILGYPDFFKLDAWIKPNFLTKEIKLLSEYLKLKKQDFSFYPNATVDDVKKVMENKNVKEVYFVGHGDSHTFELKTGETLYYCDFNNPMKYGKDFVHQIHCGTSHGKSLVDYVVLKENKDKCFFFRKTINSFDIERELKKRIKEISNLN